MPVIYLKDLVVEAKHGVHPHEKEHPQRFNICLEILLDTPANRTDELEDTLDWSELRQTVVNTVQNNTFNLVERLAQEVGQAALVLDGRAAKVTVSIDKLDAFGSGVPGVRLEVLR